MNSKKNKLIRFKKHEINKIMELYSKKISIGEWKDYSITFKKSSAIFSIHKSFKLAPIFQIKKNSESRHYTLLSQNNVINKSMNIESLIKPLKKPNLKLIKKPS